MRWPREEWSDALWQAELKPLELLVGLAYAKRAGDRSVTWAAESELQTLTGLSRDAVRRARAGLVGAGWLQLENRARQQHAARYRMTSPQTYVSRTAEVTASRTPQTYVSRTADTPDVRETTSGARETYVSDVRETTPDVREKAPKVGTTQPPPPTAADELWSVVVDNLPDGLGLTLTRSSQLDDALARLLFDGWTADALGRAVRSRDWSRGRAGAVVVWLTNLPPAAVSTPVASAAARSTRCSQYGHEHAAVTAAKGCVLCWTESQGRAG